MYGPQDIAKAVRRPRSAGRELNRLFHTRCGAYSTNPKGTGIFSKDWDYLIILDACRYDSFESLSDLSGNTTHRYSLTSATYKFIEANFSGKVLHDLVYIGANNWYLKLKDEIGSEVYEFIDLRDETKNIEWAIEDMCIPSPKAVTKSSLDFVDRYPNKRFIIHYLQPHHPFIGSEGRKYSDIQSTSLLDVVESSNRSDDELRRAYNVNLEIVLEEVEKLVEKLNGRVAITADHGEMLGDRHKYLPMKDYGHHPGIYNDSTVKVPWHTIKSGNRPTIRSDPPDNRGDQYGDHIDDQLRNLGYMV